MPTVIRSTNRIPEIKRTLQQLGRNEIKVGVFGEDSAEMVMIATVNEFGATIRPKGKFLAIPAPAARGKSPRDFSDLHFVPTRSGGLLVQNGSGPNQRGPIFFYLVRRVVIPERSFIRSGFDKYQRDIARKIDLLIPKVIEGGISPKRFADMIGLEFAGLIQQHMRTIGPPNAPATVANKGSSRPLIDTARLLGSVRHKVD